MELTGDDESKYSQTLGRRYAILPLDEAYFKIDANQRTIDIPKEFKNHGLAVQGDESAEIIYFKIHRYFDFMDLNNTEIYIQWQQGLEQNSPTGLSNEWVRDIESDPDYLIFGWALDSTITEKAGSLKFSIRFIDWKTNPETGEYILDSEGNKIISYSLSTKETTATINPGLDLNITPTNIANIEEMISRRVKRARVVGADKADLPIFTLKLMDWITAKEGSAVKEIDLEPLLDEQGNPIKDSENYELQIQAYSPDAGRITYEWYNIDESIVNSLSTEDKYERIIASLEEPFQTEMGHIYYTFDSKTNKYIADTTITSGKDTITDSNHFERYGYYKATKAGTYIGVAKNDISFDSASLPILSSGQIDKEYGPIKIPYATKANIALAEGQKYDGYVIGKTSTKLEPIITKGNDKDELNYEWYRQWENGKEEKIEGATGASYEVKDENQGFYFIKVISTRNNSAESIPSERFLVTLPALEPTVTYNHAEVYTGETIVAEAVYANDYQNGLNKSTYQWYEVGKNNSITAIPNATSQTFTPTQPGNYKCKITNTYNTDSITSISPNSVEAFRKPTEQ